MKVNSISNNIYKNQLLKKGLKFAADNGSLFAAGTSLALSTFVRPFSIMLTPNTDKEKKITIRVSDKEYDLIEEYAMKHSITKSEVLKKALLYIRESK